MKMLKKLTAFACSLVIGSAAFAYTLDDYATAVEYLTKVNLQLDEISNGLDDFTGQLAIAVPQAATQQNVWANAYVGKLFPSIPPHFGGGFNVGATHINTSGLAAAAKALNIKGIKDDFYFPVFTADLRIGGIFLPFDLDVAVMKTGTLNIDKISQCNLGVELLTVGADLRYAILEGGVIAPKLSIGAGYFYNQGSLTAKSDYASADLSYKVHTMYLQAQLSKKILFITPFIGVRGLVSKYNNSWSWKAGTKITDPLHLDELAALGIQPPVLKTADSGTKASEKFDFSAIQPQVYAGVGLGFLVFDLTASVTCDLRHISDSKLMSGALSLRASL